MLSYTLTPDPLRHRYVVKLLLPVPEVKTLTLAMAAWTPGSYTLRDYSGRLCDLKASVDAQSLTITEVTKGQWTIPVGDLPSDALIELTWSVFAFSLGVHDAWIDNDHGFINPCAVFLYPTTEEHKKTPSKIKIQFNADGWHIFSALDRDSTHPNTWFAHSLDELLDAPWALTPVGSKNVHVLQIEAAGIPHKVVITGAGSQGAVDCERLTRDFSKIFETTIRFWDPKEGRAPFSRYLLTLHVATKLYGGLEHAAGAALLEDPECIPSNGEETPPAKYADLLTLVGHEYFHAWLIKRLKPSSFLPYDLSKESHSHDLWIFEGITSYYESLLPYRAEVIGIEACLANMADRLNAAFTREGFDHMSLAESSFDAWTKLYHPTADAFYSQVSYYAKGALAALILDHELRVRSAGAVSLDSFLADWFAKVREDIARHEWQGLKDETIADVIENVSAIDVHDLIQKLVHGKNDRAWWLAAVQTALHEKGLELLPSDKVPATLRYAGIRWSRTNGSVVLNAIPSVSPAFVAGLFAGDEIIAIDEERSTPENFERQIERARHRCVTVHYFRSSRLLTTTLDLSTSPSTALQALLPQTIRQIA